MARAACSGARRLLAAVLVVVVATSMLLPAGPAMASAAVLVVDLSLVDGTAPFDADDLPGHDASPTNGIVRTNDSLIYQVEVLVTDVAASDVTISMELAQGTELVSVPPFCLAGSSVTPSTLPDPAVPTTPASWTTLPRQLLHCNVGDRVANSTFVYPIVARVRPEVPHGTVLDPVVAEATSIDALAPAVSDAVGATVSARARYDISINALSLGENDGYVSSTLVTCGDGSGRLCYRYIQAITISAPAGGRGTTPLAGPVTFAVDLSPGSLYGEEVLTHPAFVAAGADALDRYGARFVSCAHLNWMNLGRKVGGSATWTAANSVRDSGTTTCAQPGGKGNPVHYSVTGMDSTALTYPVEVERPENVAVPGDAAYVYSSAIAWELPVQAIVDLGVATPVADPSSWVLAWTNRVVDFAPAGIDGVPADPAADRPTNDHRRSTVTVQSSGTWQQFFTGVGNGVGNVAPSTFNPGWGVWEGPAGGTGLQSGEGQLYPGKAALSTMLLHLGTAVTQVDTSVLGCQSWDPELLQLTADAYPTSTVAALQRLPSNGAPVWVHGFYTNGGYVTDPALVPHLTVEYGTGPGGSGAGASQCRDDSSPGGWFADPSAVPGNDPALAAEGVYTAVSRVRYHMVVPPPTTGGGPYASVAVALRAEPSLPTGVVLPAWATGKIAFGEHTLAEMVATPWPSSNYNPATNTGNQGDRLRTSRAMARISKQVKHPQIGVFGTTTPQLTGGQTAEFRLTPTLTAGILTDASALVRVEDCLPAGVSLESSSHPASLVQPVAPPDADLTCGTDETYVRFELGPQVVNAPITPIDYTVRLSPAITGGTKVNTARVTAEGDPSSAAQRTTQAGITVVQPAGVAIDKVALTPLVEPNPVGAATVAPLRWRVDYANLETSPGPTDIDIIDVLPRDGVDGTSFTGTLAFDEVIVLGGSTGTQPVEVLYTSAVTVDHDPHGPSNLAGGATVWCDAPIDGDVVIGDGASADCPETAAEVTGLRLRRAGAFGPSDVLVFEVVMVPSGNTGGDVYVNTVAGRGAGLAMMTGPVLAPARVISSSIGDRVFLDVNGNGLQDPGEPGVPGFGVTLVGTDADGDPVTRSTTTDASGAYVFDGLRSGTYTVIFAPSSLGDGQELTFARQGANALVDSDGDPVTGEVTVVLPPNTDLVSVDQGVLEPAPSLRIMTRIDGDAATHAPGVEVAAATTMTVTYEVENTGNLTIGAIAVTDPGLGATELACPRTLLAPGETMTCTAVLPAPLPGFSHTSTGIAVGTPVPTAAGTQLPDVGDANPAHAHVVAAPAVSITTLVVPNGQLDEMDDADVAPGLGIVEGGIASWHYLVENPGNAELVVVSVRADDGTDGTTDPGDDWDAEPVLVDGRNVGDTDGDGLLDPGEQWVYVSPSARDLEVTGGVRTAAATVVAHPTYPDAPTLTDQDAASHHGIPRSVAITSLVQGVHASAEPGPLVAVGAPVRWTYVVTNDGGADLYDLTVTDDRPGGDGIDCDGTGTATLPGPLAPGESFTCVALGVATPGQHATSARVDGVGPTLPARDGGTQAPKPVAATTLVRHLGADPSVHVATYTQTVAAPTPDAAPHVAVPDPVRWTYVVANVGNVPLHDVVVSDDALADGVAVDCGPGATGATSDVVPTLAVGEVRTCMALGVAVEGPSQATGRATAVGPATLDVDGQPVAGAVVSAADPSHHWGVRPAIEVVARVQGEDADDAPGPWIRARDAVGRTFVVTNVGNAALTDVTVDDDVVGPASCPVTTLAPGASMTCWHDGVADGGQVRSIVTATGVGPPTRGVDGEVLPGRRVADGDRLHYFGVVAAVSLTIVPMAEGVGVDVGLRPGSPVVYRVENTGNTRLVDLVVTDGEGTVVPCPASALDPGASMDCAGWAVLSSGAAGVAEGSVVGRGPSTLRSDGGAIGGGLAVATEPLPAAPPHDAAEGSEAPDPVAVDRGERRADGRQEEVRLPRTGREAGTLAGAGTVLLAVGLALLRLRRRLG